MKAFIYTGGSIFPENITEHPKADDLCIAADAGYLNAQKLGEHVDLIVGDFDSLGENNIPKAVQVQRVPSEKDFTDTQLAVDTAIKRGADQLVIIGGLDGRLDHTLSNIHILEDLYTRKIYSVITDGKNRVHYIKSSSTLLPRSGYKYLSLIVADGEAKGVTIEGCKYPLKNARLECTFQYAVSNEITGNCALVSVKKGGLFIVESRD